MATNNSAPVRGGNYVLSEVWCVLWTFEYFTLLYFRHSVADLSKEENYRR